MSAIHAVPVPGEAVTSCCGRTVFELPFMDRMTADPTAVTCPGLTAQAPEHLQTYEERVALLETLPTWTLFRCGWSTPAGPVQGPVYYRVPTGLGPVGRDSIPETLLCAAARWPDEYQRRGQLWGIEVLAEAVA